MKKQAYIVPTIRAVEVEIQGHVLSPSMWTEDFFSRKKELDEEDDFETNESVSTNFWGM
ncbi:MAG: hypothetical protein IJS89_01255 [Bacteroidaceae bacterium]|nr:hypothetical protein [Bacteroidaceae bacterium]